MPVTAMKEDRGFIEINTQECKGCGLCVEACVQKALHLSAHLNHYGYHPAEYNGRGCNGCGVCFFACPEPGAIKIFKAVA